MKYLILITLTSLSMISCGQTPTDTETMHHKEKNELKNETSPYLLQHVYNPVNWHPWNAETLAKAKAENKMMIISVGYAACHWCHVMEHESFENDTVAAIMNKHFIPIKVDREERPDIDDIYMTACQLTSQRGCGWPLNAFALPDGKPYWAGTYFPKEQWTEILNHFADMYTSDPENLKDAADKLTQGIIQSEQLISVTEPEVMPTEVLEEISAGYLKRADREWGGRTGAPKFPMPSNFSYLLQHLYHNPSDNLDEYLNHSLMRISHGGIYDHLGGGWSRYSVDARWHVPHFEKMLYDNGQLLQLYADAYSKYKEPYMRDRIYQTIEWLEREMKDKSGGYYSSLDADSEGVEGKFYVWTDDELQAALGPKNLYERFKTYYTIQKRGNWEHHMNVLHQVEKHDKLAESFNITPEQLKKEITEAHTLLMTVRDKRVRPGTDDKILTSWNALTLIGLARASRALNDDDIRSTATQLGEFLKNKSIQADGSLNRNYKNGRSTISGFLDDYAITALAFIELYQITFNEEYLSLAKKITDHAVNYFYDQNSKLFYYTSSSDDPLITRKKEINDNVIPSSNSYMAEVLWSLGHYLGEKQYVDKARLMAEAISPSIAQNQNPHFWSNWLKQIERFQHPGLEIAVTGPDAMRKIRELQTHYIPALYTATINSSTLPLLEGKESDDVTRIFVCYDQACKLPVENVDLALKGIFDK